MTFIKGIVLALVLLMAQDMVVYADAYSDGAKAFKRRKYDKAMLIWRPLALQGDAKAQINIGLMYAKGLGVPTNTAEALKWSQLAADQGLAQAQTYLGYMYEDGKGVAARDYTKAAKWYRKAALQGYGQAQFNLGVLYADGHGLEKDLVQAFLWLDLATNAGVKKARKTRGLEARNMSKGQISEARKLSREWAKKLPKKKRR
jgi:hypothetical protein